MNEVYIDDHGNKIWRNCQGYHREDGPAIECFNGKTYWCIDGKLHREDGPAIEHIDGITEWYLIDKCYSFEKWLEVIPASLEEKILLKLRYG